MKNIRPNYALAEKLKVELKDHYNLSGYVEYYLTKTYSNPFGNKSKDKNFVFDAFRAYEPDITAVGRKAFYRKMLKKGYTPEMLADLLGVGLLQSVVEAMLGCDSGFLSALVEFGLLKVIETKEIHPYYGNAYVEPVFSASSVFAYMTPGFTA